MPDAKELLALRQALYQPIDDRPVFGRPLKTQRTSLIKDDREDSRETRGGVYKLPSNSVPSLTGLAHTLPSSPLAFAPSSQDELMLRGIIAALGNPQPSQIAIQNAMGRKKGK